MLRSGMGLAEWLKGMLQRGRVTVRGDCVAPMESMVKDGLG